MSLEIRVLGPLEVLVDGEPLRVDTRKALAILALLAVDGRPFARDELAAMFWPESDDESARGALRRTLSVLRASLADRWLRVDRAVVDLPAAPDVTVDLARLDALARGAVDWATLAEAAAIARGPFLAGFSLRDSASFDDWRVTRAVAAERRIVDVLDRLTTAAEAGGDHAAAADAASRLVELDPLDEPARQRLMTILARGGDRTGAIREYRATVAVLERELGVAPLAATTELYEAIRDARLTASVPLPAVVMEVPAPAAPGAEEARSAAMVGRDGDLAALVSVHRASTPDGSIVVVRGEAGVGKTRLTEALIAAVVEAGGMTLAARAFASEASIAYAPITDLLATGLRRVDTRATLDELPAAVLAEVGRLVALPPGLVSAAAPASADSPAGRARLLDAIAATLTALVRGPVPGLLVLEDAQWADGASREAFAYLARRLAGRPVLLLVTARDEALDPDASAFLGTLAALPRAVSRHLGRLSHDDVARLVDAVGGTSAAGARWDPAVLAAESEGLPLYVVEALAAGPSAGEAPRGVRALLRQRLDAVDETAAQVLAAGAVIGRSFDFETVRGASGRSEDETLDALDGLVRHGIIREVATPGGPVFDFAHARLRDEAYQRTGLARRRLLHRRVAEILRASGGREDVARLAQMATHEHAAGRDAAAADAYRDAGYQARTVFATREALEHFAAAVALGHPDVVGLHVAIGEARTVLGDYGGAVTALETAAALAGPATLPGIELRIGRVHARRGDVVQAASHLDAALAGTLPPAERAHALVERGAVALRAGDLELAARMAEDAGAAATPESDRRVGASVARLAGLVAQAQGDLGAARAHLQHSLRVAADEPAVDDPEPAIAARNALALVEAALGHRDTAIELLEEALVACRRTGELHLEAAVENNLADQLHAAGRQAEAMGHQTRAVTLFAEVGVPGQLEPEIWKLVSW